MKWRTAVDRALTSQGLTHAQYVVLSSLVALDRPSQRELADHTGLEPLYVSKLARALEASGFIARTRDTVDTRTVRLTLTDRGHEVVVPAIAVVGALLDRLLEPLGGRSGDRTEALSHELTALLDVPLD
jgi:DNA-binding MarR family transcriptional regulator